MKKYEVFVDDEKAEELTSLLKKLPYVKEVKESEQLTDLYTLASEKSLSEDWLLNEDDALQKLYGK
ncbi:MAG: hypothetical protein K2Q24_14730 [Chitinophagaceae bacterium]|jgi:hypothetical protein|nr:hypothetical protein [Chitinophagaceae bacterium]